VQNRCWSSVDGLREQIHPVSAYLARNKVQKTIQTENEKIKPSTIREMIAIYFIGLSPAWEAVFLKVHRDCVRNLAHHLCGVFSARLSPT
jgi:hypothetical protein